MAKTPTPCENRPSCKPSGGQQGIHASPSRSSKYDTKTSTSDRQPRAPANTRVTTPASTRPSIHGKTEAGSEVTKSTCGRQLLRQTRKDQGSERVLDITRALRSSSTPEGSSLRTTASTFCNTPTTTPPSTSSSTPPGKPACVLARQREPKSQKRVGYAPPSKPTITPVSSRHGSSKASAQGSAPGSTHGSTPTIRPRSFPGSSVPGTPASKQVKEPENKSVSVASNTPVNRQLSPPACMHQTTGFNKLQSITTSLPQSGHANISASAPSWSRALTQAEWSTPTQSSMPASMPTLPNIPEISQQSVPGNVPASTLVKVPENPPQSTNEPPNETSNAPANVIISTPECSPDSVLECLPENQDPNLPDGGPTSRTVKRPPSRPSSGPGRRPGSLSTSKRASKRTNRSPGSPPVSSSVGSPVITPENTRDRPGCARERPLQNRRQENLPITSEIYTPSSLSRALANKLRSSLESNDAGSESKTPYASEWKSTRIPGNKSEIKTKFPTIPEATHRSRLTPSIVLLLDTDAFFQNSLSM